MAAVMCATTATTVALAPCGGKRQHAGVQGEAGFLEDVAA